MQFGSLYDQAVGLSPRAARIAAKLLVQEPAMPAALRRSLTMALAPTEEATEVADLRPSDPDVRAASEFVHACQAACSR